MPIFDQGYQHWSGDLSGHTWRWLAITRQGVRSGMKNRVLRMTLLSAWLPAMALVMFLCVWGLIEQKSSMIQQSSMIAAMIKFFSHLFPDIVTDPRHYRADVWRLAYSFFLRTELFFSMILILLVGPNLISLDLRFNALPLYFSRPMRRIDYFLGKLGVIVAFLGMVMIVPAVAAYILGMLFSLDITILRDTFTILLSSIAYGLIISVSAGLLVLAMSALSRKSRYVALAWVAIWFVSGITANVLQGVASQQRRFAHYNEINVPPPDFRKNLTRDERQRQMQQWRIARQNATTQFDLGELEFSKNDWRPLVSYVNNLSRIGQLLLRTDDTWKDLGQLQPDPQTRDQFLAQHMGPQYPWYWSAGVLAGLFVLSTCILNLSIKSLDRLK